VTGWHLKNAARVMREGGIVAYPTESVYGLGCDPWDAYAVIRLLKLKKRSYAKGLILVAADFDQIAPWLAAPTATLRNKLTQKTPRPVTWLVDAPDTPLWIRGEHPKLAVRIIRHPLAAELCNAFGGPIVSTSANISGGETARNPLRVRKLFQDKVDYIVSGPVGPYKTTSEIRDLGTGVRYRS
jgi:L-threonylcarbamoyladenylate synthase